MKYEKRMYKRRQIIKFNVHILPKATKTFFQCTKHTLYNHSSWLKSIAKKLLFFIFSATGKFFHNISKSVGMLGLPKYKEYRWFSFNDQFATIVQYAFSKHCIQFRIWKYMCILYTFFRKRSSCYLLLPEYLVWIYYSYW